MVVHAHVQGHFYLKTNTTQNEMRLSLFKSRYLAFNFRDVC